MKPENQHLKVTKASLLAVALTLPQIQAAVWTVESWTSAATDGQWFNDAHWDTAAPNGVDAVADFTFAKSGTADFIGLSSSPTVGHLFFENTSASEENFLIMAGGGSGNRIFFEVSSGNATVGAAADMTLNIRGGMALTSPLEKIGPGHFIQSVTDIQGSGAFIMNGGTARFTGANNAYTGGTIVNVGSLDANWLASMGTGDVAVNGQGQVVLTSTGDAGYNNNFIINGQGTDGGADDGAIRLRGTSINGTVELQSDSRISLSDGSLNASESELRNVVSGTGGLELTGTGTNPTLTLLAANTYTGATTVQSGQLLIDPASTATSPLWTVNGGSLHLPDDSGSPIENLIGAPAVTVNGGALQVINNTETIGTLTMDSSVEPATFITANNGAGTTTATLTVGTLDLTGTENFLEFDTAPALGTYEVLKATTINGTLGTNLRIDGVPPLSQSWSFSGGVVSVTLSAYPGNAITYTNLSGNAMWTIDGDTDWTDGSAIGYYDTDDVTFNDTANGLPGSLAVDIPSTVNPGSVTFNNSTGNDYSLTGSDIAGSTGLTKSGTGTLSILQSNTYTGTTDINGGTLVVGNNIDEVGSLGTGDVTVASGAFLDFNRPSSSTYDNSITLNGTLSQTGSGFADINGDITGSGDIIQATGAATFALDGQNNFSGSISLDNGTSFIRGGGSTYSGNITLALGTELDLGSSSTAPAGDVLVSGIISGDGNLDVNLGNGEKAILTGENDYTGTTSIGSSDTLQIGDGGTTGLLGTGDVDMDVSTSTLIFNRSTAITANNNFVLDGTIRQEGGGDLILGGNIIIDDNDGAIVTTAGTTSLNGALTCEVDTTSGSSQTLIVTGALNLGGATLTLIEDNPGVLTEGTKTTLIDYTGGSLTGSFAGLPEGATVTLGSNSFEISYADASQVTLTAVASGYSAWATINAGGQGPDLDFDKDGVPNGVEYFFGETGSSFTPNPGIVGGTITWPKDPSANATFVVEVSTNLQDEVAPGDGGWTAANPIDVVDNGTSVVYTVPTGYPRLFARLRVIVP